jgi:hypothetical protein
VLRENIKKYVTYNQFMSSETETETKEKKVPEIRVALKEVMKHPTKRVIDYIGPTGLWLFLYYASSLFVMIVINIARIGWSLEAIFKAPIYITQLFLSYGLNAGKVEDTSIGNDVYYDKVDFDNFMISAAWFFAPMIIYVLGIIFVILPSTGFPQPIGDYPERQNFLYFHNFVPFLNENKRGGFYFLIVWVPLIVSIVLGAFLSKRFFKEGKGQPNINVIHIMIFNLLAGFVVGLQMGLITGSVDFDIRGALRTIFTNSYDNEGYFFSGQYHPNSIMITSWFINFLPLFVAVLYFAVYGSIEDRILGKHKIDAELEKVEKEEPA